MEPTDGTVVALTRAEEDIRWQVAKDAGTSRVRERYSPRPPTIHLLAARFTAVVGAWKAKDELVLRAALVDLGAVVNAWIESIEVPPRTTEARAVFPGIGTREAHRQGAAA